MDSTGLHGDIDGGIRVRMRAALRASMASRDPVAASALRSALAALDNAEAVEVGPGMAGGSGPSGSGVPPGGAVSPRDNRATGSPTRASTVRSTSQHIAGAVAGLGAAEVERRTLSAAQAEAIVRAEIGEREDAARDYEASGHPDLARRLRAQARVLTQILAGQSVPEGRG